jgi:RNA polymerase II subunit A C-terminal domain phosphatase
MLRISQREASRREEVAKRRLLASKKLSLVVDLDQTIIHAAVDPTIAEWQKDKDNPNYEAVKDVRAFQLIDDGPGMRGCWYYIKLRPGLEDFLKQISQIYELHIYTMGTRQYAEKIANIVDPDRKYFGDRILSRDESGSVTNKNLERLFPIDTKMVVIIDDRGDVWKWNANLVRVIPFDFFVGIGDINSSFLPKKQEIKATPNPEKSEDAKPEHASTNGDDLSKPDEKVQDGAESGALTATNGTDSSALEQLVAMGGGDDPIVREIQSKGQEETIAAQLEEKPLLQMQKLLDAKDQAAAAAAGAEEDGTTGVLPNGDTQDSKPESESSSSSSEAAEPTPSNSPKPLPTRHSLLRDDDRELASLSARLTAVHTAFYNEYDRQRLGQKGGRVAALSGKGGKIQLQSDPATFYEDASDLLLVPDIKSIMPAMKQRVLSGVVIVFSGVLPLETNVQTADISFWAKTFGATITEKVSRKVTHVVAARSGTSKVKQGVRRERWVVSTQWLIDCMTGWKRVKEDDYVLQDLRGGMKKKNLDGSPERSEAGDDRKELLQETRGFLLSSDEGEGETTGLDTEAENEDNRRTGTNGARSDSQPDRKRLKLDTDNLTDDESMTTDKEESVNRFMEDASPLSINQDEWADMDKELREFMGSDVESDSETESVSSKLSSRIAIKRKRQDDADENDTDGRRRGANSTSGGSTLKGTNATSPVGNGPSNNPNEYDDTEIRRQQNVVEAAERQEEADELSSDDELARELERELEESSGNDEEGFMGAKDTTGRGRGDDMEPSTTAPRPGG